MKPNKRILWKLKFTSSLAHFLRQALLQLVRILLFKSPSLV